MAGEVGLSELHAELEHARTPRELNALLRTVSRFAPGHLNECSTCAAARDRIEDKATDLHERVEHDFSLHPPRNEAAAEHLDRIRTAAKTFAHEVVDSTPVSREQSRALSSIEDALAQAIAAFVRNQS